MKKEKIFTALFFSFVLLVLLLGIRGIVGNPTAETINNIVWTDDGPLELSPDRGRFSLLYSIAENLSLKFSLPIARFATPDLGITPNGEYVSLFAPGVSFIVLPGYVVGKLFGVSQVGAFAVIALFALFNAGLVRAIAMRLGASSYAASFGALAFLFASPAFAYAVTLYQHHISTFLILSSIYVLLRWHGWWSIAYVWFALALALSVDYPNIVLMVPIGLWALSRIVWFEKDTRGLRFKISFLNILTVVSVILPLAFFLWYNTVANGNPLQLSGTLKRVEAIDEFGKPAQSQLAQTLGLAVSNPNRKKSAINFFHSRNLLNGFYTHFISPDRGVINFAPIMLLGFFGLAYVFKKNVTVGKVLAGIIGFNILLYSMWGDPYGGWAFGSRYLIPSYAILGIGIAKLLEYSKKRYIVLAICMTLVSQSIWIGVLGAVTSNRNPPQIEILALEKISGREEKYSYDRNEQYLASNHAKSFIFNTIGYRYISATGYRTLIASLVIAMCALLLGGLLLDTQKEKRHE
ncbi:MAG: hypothetical protein AAB482_02295 [Patescibacteria group bacterium]